MKNIKQFLEGRHHFIKRIDKSKKKEYSCQPKTQNELRNIIKQRVEENPNCDLNDIDVSKIKDMGYVFAYTNFNGDISDWDVSNVTSMHGMFESSKFTGENSDISNWDVSKVKDMGSLFSLCRHLDENTIDISDWDVSSVENMAFMFNRTKFNGDLSAWDVSSVKNMSLMFQCSAFTGKNGDISLWDVSAVERMNGMFIGCKEFNLDLSSWNVNPEETLTDNMFAQTLVRKNNKVPSWCEY